MKFVMHDGNFQVAPDDVQSYDKLPAGYYKIEHDSSHDIFSLNRTYQFTLTESKVYGVQVDKMNKVVNAYSKSNRSLGVLLTGDKGIGKSLFAKLLCMTMFAKGYPIIIVDKSYKGLEKFLSEIPGDVVLLFDEFDKIFETSNNSEGRDESSQESLLTLFDGTSSQKRLFIITANDTSNLNDCIINRPGRFHYHFIFEYPNDSQIIEYMKDNMDNFSMVEANKVITLSKAVKINYDTLRSICFEYNLGQNTLEEFINDINVKSQSAGNKYKFTFKTISGGTVELFNCIETDSPIFDSFNSEVTYELSRSKDVYSSPTCIEIKPGTLRQVDNYFLVSNYKLEPRRNLEDSNIDTSKEVKIELQSYSKNPLISILSNM